MPIHIIKCKINNKFAGFHIFFSMPTLCCYRIQIKTTLQKLHRLMDALKGLFYIYSSKTIFKLLPLHSLFHFLSVVKKLHTSTFFCRGNRSTTGCSIWIVTKVNECCGYFFGVMTLFSSDLCWKCVYILIFGIEISFRMI